MNRIFIFYLGLLLFSCVENTIKTDENFEEILLPDQSVVMLNQNSSLSYDPAFTERKVKLHGEAFFNVVKGEVPFTVRTDHGDILVLGTKFNVRSDQESLEVQVKEGGVEIKSSDFMEQVGEGMKATLKKGEKQLKKTKADLNYDQWVADLEKEVKKLGKGLKKEARELKKEGNKLGKELKEESKKIGNEVKEEAEKLKEKIKSAVEE